MYMYKKTDAEIDAMMIDLLTDAYKEHPRLRLKSRGDSQVLDALLSCLSIVTRQDYTGYTQTIGSTIYLPATWEEMDPVHRYITLRHELKHIEQFERFPFGRRLWFINAPIVALLYLFVLPFFFTFRAKFEREAYRETFAAYYDCEGPIDGSVIKSRAERMSRIFGGSSYMWMWNKEDARNWAIKTQLDIEMNIKYVVENNAYGNEQ